MSEPVRPVAELEQPSSSRAQHAPPHVSTSPLNQRNDEETSPSPKSRGRRVRLGGMIRESLMSLGSRIPSPSYTLENTGSAGTFCVCVRGALTLWLTITASFLDLWLISFDAWL